MVQNESRKALSLIFAVLILILSLVYIPDWQAVGIFRGASLMQRLSFSFFHASFLHALLNVWCFLSIVYLTRLSWPSFAVAFVIAVCAPSFLLPSEVPVVGLSLVCFALLGRVGATLRRPRQIFTYHGSAVFYLGAGFFFPSAAGLLHLYAYVAGLLAGLFVAPFPRR